MPETKPFTSPAWNNPRYSRHTSQHVHYLHNMKKTVRCFLWGNSKYTMRILKCVIILALIMTCIFNIRLAFNAKSRYERHKQLFIDDLNEKTFIHSYVDDYENNVDQSQQHGYRVEVVSSQELVEVKVNGEVVVRRDNPDDRGMHVIALNQLTGKVMATRTFDTYVEGQDVLMREFLDSINDEDRLLLFAVKDEASLHLSSVTRNYIKAMGSSRIDQLEWRGMWAFVTDKKALVRAEDLKPSSDATSWGDAVELKVEIESASAGSLKTCDWPQTVENIRRQQFCSKYDGYGRLCACDDPDSLILAVNHLPDNLVHDIPVAVIASNRPHYLYRMLRSLLSASGANPTMITVFIDGYFEETMEVAKLMGVKGIYHTPSGVKNARISQHYRSSLAATFSLNRDAKYMIIVEEDLDVSPDFFSFFSQTIHLMDVDSSLYCISAWNDQGYDHSSKDPSLLYRVETFPGLGWLLSRSLFKDELEEQWPSPDKRWDWDMWMRQPVIRKERECIIPDVSRTFHFGSSGINMNSYFHNLYFTRHTLNRLSNVQLRDVGLMTKDNYEKLMHELVRGATLTDHTKSPCADDFLTPENSFEDIYIVYLAMESPEKTDIFLQLSKCLRIWDLDVRGLHKFSFRTFIKNRHVVFVGYPVSPYSIYKPVDVKPIAVGLIE